MAATVIVIAGENIFRFKIVFCQFRFSAKIVRQWQAVVIFLWSSISLIHSNAIRQSGNYISIAFNYRRLPV